MHRSLVRLHTLLASFFLPMGLLYALTGGLYGLGVKGNYTTAEHVVTLSDPLEAELSDLVASAERELGSLGIAVPSGSAGVKKGGTSFYLEWTGLRRDVQLHPTIDPLVATLKIKDTTPHRFFVQLHKAKGGVVFKWFAAFWMVGLIALFASGGLMAFSIKPYRKLATLGLVSGVGAFVVFIFLS